MRLCYILYPSPPPSILRPRSPKGYRQTHNMVTLPSIFHMNFKHFTNKLVERGVDHLLLDLPSVDKEVDGGALKSHRAFFGVDIKPRGSATITEFVFTPDIAPDGLYALNLQVAPFDLDASPSRPVIYPLLKASQ